MSITEAGAGEVVDEVIPLLEHDEARQLTDDINVCTIDVAVMVAAAWRGQAWKALGYKNWEQYADEELPLLGSNRANRHVLLVSLRNVGMSTRAIAAVTGLNQSTVSRHVSGDANASGDDGAGAANATPEVTGTDGKTYPARTTRRQPDGEPTKLADTAEGGGDDGEPLDGDANPASEPIGDGADSHDVGRSEPEPPPELDSASIRRETKKLRDAKKAELREKDHGPELSASAQTILDEAYNIDRRPTQIANDLHRATMLFTAWRPETIHDVNDPDITKGVDDLIEVAGRWIERFNASRPKPFDVIKGDAR